MVQLRRSLLVAFFSIGLLLPYPWHVQAQHRPSGSRPATPSTTHAPVHTQAHTPSNTHHGSTPYHHATHQNHDGYHSRSIYPGLLLGSSVYNYFPYSDVYRERSISDYQAFYPPALVDQPYFPIPPILPVEATNQPAQIEMLLPAGDAQVWVEGQLMSSTGTRRIFFTPQLAPGAYTYQLAVSWRQDGEPVRVERMIRVTPGQTVIVDFTRINGAQRMPLVDD